MLPAAFHLLKRQKLKSHISDLLKVPQSKQERPNAVAGMPGRHPAPHTPYSSKRSPFKCLLQDAAQKIRLLEGKLRMCCNIWQVCLLSGVKNNIVKQISWKKLQPRCNIPDTSCSFPNQNLRMQILTSWGKASLAEELGLTTLLLSLAQGENACLLS